MANVSWYLVSGPLKKTYKNWLFYGKYSDILQKFQGKGKVVVIDSECEIEKECIIRFGDSLNEVIKEDIPNNILIIVYGNLLEELKKLSENSQKILLSKLETFSGVPINYLIAEYAPRFLTLNQAIKVVNAVDVKIDVVSQFLEFYQRGIEVLNKFSNISTNFLREFLKLMNSLENYILNGKYDGCPPLFDEKMVYILERNFAYSLFLLKFELEKVIRKSMLGPFYQLKEHYIRREIVIKKLLDIYDNPNYKVKSFKAFLLKLTFLNRDLYLHFLLAFSSKLYLDNRKKSPDYIDPGENILLL